MPRRTDFSLYDAHDLARVAASRLLRPGQILRYLKRSEKVTELEIVGP
ncbi:MAG TPA: hypothetical protein VMW47_10225 [Verrucomicrobiae bacterium]|nr:hypothetical protein [Verrucomicrobiae bacterium]